MKHQATPLRRLVAPEDFDLPAAWLDEPTDEPVTDETQGDAAWLDAIAEHASMQVRFRR